jgi:hypothetical protein
MVGRIGFGIDRDFPPPSQGRVRVGGGSSRHSGAGIEKWRVVSRASYAVVQPMRNESYGPCFDASSSLAIDFVGKLPWGVTSSISHASLGDSFSRSTGDSMRFRTKATRHVPHGSRRKGFECCDFGTMMCLRIPMGPARQSSKRCGNRTPPTLTLPHKAGGNRASVGSRYRCLASSISLALHSI